MAHLELIPTGYKSQEKRHRRKSATELLAELMPVYLSFAQSLTAPQESDIHHNTSPHGHRVDYCTEHHSPEHVWAVWVNKSPSGKLSSLYESVFSFTPRQYIRGVTVHKIHGSVRYDTVVSRFGMFSIHGAGQLVTSKCWKYFCLKPWRQTRTHLHQGLHTCKLCARFMPVNILISVISL